MDKSMKKKKSKVIDLPLAKKRGIKRTELYLYLMLIPGIIFFILFRYVPMYGIVMAFQDFQIGLGFADSPWVGLDNFARIMQDPYFWNAMKNTMILNLLVFFFGMPVPILFALLLNEVAGPKFKKAIQTIVYLPHFVNWVVYAGIVIMMLSPSTGIVNFIIKTFGGDPVAFMENSKWWRVVYVGADVLKGFGWASIIYYAAIVSVDQEMYEAAKIDGASRAQRMRYLTLPSIAPTINIMLILQIGKIVTIGFDQVWTMSNNMVLDVSEVISTYIYRRTLGPQAGLFPQFGYMAAVGLFQSLLALVLVLISDRISKKIGQKGII
ncbi:MAG: ABC transporter permease subunit [Clostridia bacterium]